MRLAEIKTLTADIELLTGLHIGGGDADMHIGGIDNSVIKHPVTQEPYIPGSSIKGKMRSLLEWELGVVQITNGKPLGYNHLDAISDGDKKEAAKALLKLFGAAPESSGNETLVKEIGPTRLAFWDCQLDEQWKKDMRGKNLLFTEAKMENSIDRIRGVAENPRQTERVPAGAKFQFRLTLRIHNDRIHNDDGELMNTILKGLRLIELSGLGGSGSRGYGKVKFNDLKCDEEPLDKKWSEIKPFDSEP